MPRPANGQESNDTHGECKMKKTLAAIGISAAIAFAPLAALAQTDTTAPAPACSRGLRQHGAGQGLDEEDRRSTRSTWPRRRRSRRKVQWPRPLRPRRRGIVSQCTIQRIRNEPPHPTDGATFFCSAFAPLSAASAVSNSRASGRAPWRAPSSGTSSRAPIPIRRRWRIGALADERGVKLVWRPFLLGPIFAAQGWRDSPFNIFPAKGRYMWRDLARTCEAMGVPFTRPEPFPQPSLLAARVALTLDGAERADFSRRVFAAEFGEGMAIGDRLDSWRVAGRLGGSIRRRRSSGPKASRSKRSSRPNARAPSRLESSARPLS